MRVDRVPFSIKWNVRSCKHVRVEVVAAQVVVGTGLAGTQRLAFKNAEIAYLIGRLSGAIARIGSIRIEGAAGAHRKRYAAHPADDRVDHPATENVFAGTSLHPRLSFTKRQCQHSPDLE